MILFRFAVFWWSCCYKCPMFTVSSCQSYFRVTHSTGEIFSESQVWVINPGKEELFNLLKELKKNVWLQFLQSDVYDSKDGCMCRNSLRESVGDPIIDFDGFQLKKVTVTVSPVFWMVDAFQKLNTLILQKPRSTNKQQKHLVLLHSSHQKTGFSPQYLSWVQQHFCHFQNQLPWG